MRGCFPILGSNPFYLKAICNVYLQILIASGTMKAISLLKIITVINLLVATGFSIAGVIAPLSILPAGITPEKATSIFALYAAARTIPLAVIAIISIVRKNNDVLLMLAFLAGTIQFLDGFVGLYQHDVSKSAGPFGIAVVQFIAIYFAARQQAAALKNK
jgi:hypothetical protein